MLRRIARECRGWSLRDVKQLLRSPWHEDRLVALLALVELFRRGEARSRSAIVRLYLRSTRSINNWDLVDVSAPAILGGWIATPGGRSLLARLARSTIVWERRMALLATFPEISKGRTARAIRVATMLLNDEHDLIHKATGWTLREVGKRDRRALTTFLDRHAGRMPRTMLRYALERLPPATRARYMKQGRR
jgi:3-methyladenine DNA glycosylase AlkD